MVFDNNYHYNAMPVRLLVNIQDADSDGIQTASENNNGTRMGYNRPMEKNTLSARAPSPWLPLLLAIAIFMQMLDATILNTALPEIAADLNESPLNMQLAVIFLHADGCPADSFERLFGGQVRNEKSLFRFDCRFYARIGIVRRIGFAV